MTVSGPRVSVVIPAWNAAATLAETLSSAAMQSVRDIEILIVDDGSTDDTPAIAASAARQDPRIQLVQQDNAGVAAARNAGLYLARAPYVAWLDADDLWHPTKLARQLELFEGSSEALSFVYTGYRIINVAGVVQSNPRTLADVSGHTLFRQIATTYFTNVSSIMAPTALARTVGGHDPSLRAAGFEGAEDLLLQLRLARHGPAGFVPSALVGYRIHGANMSRSIARAAQSNLLALSKLAAEGVDAPEWVWRLGHGRMAGFALQMLAARSPAAALGFLRVILAKAPAETLTTLALSLPFQGQSWLRLRPIDPCLGRQFADANPALVPIEGHMLLRPDTEARLRAADEIQADSPKAR